VAGETFATGINNPGQIVGYYYSNGIAHGFLETIGGKPITIDDQLGTGGTFIRSINDSGQIAGYYIDSSGGTHGFEATPSNKPPLLSLTLTYLINQAEQEITNQENTPGFSNPSHLTNDSALVNAIANGIAGQFGTPQNQYTIGMTPGDVTYGFINLTSELNHNQNYQDGFIDQCVALVQALDRQLAPNVGTTKQWHPGTAVDIGGTSVANLPVGTPIATFTDGSPTGKYNGDHAAIFLGSGVENGAAGFFVLDQYNLPPAGYKSPAGYPLFPYGTPLNVDGYEPAEIRFIAIQGAAADPKASEYYSIATAQMVQSMASFGVNTGAISTLSSTESVPDSPPLFAPNHH
jgi:hypothetical protein